MDRPITCGSLSVTRYYFHYPELALLSNIEARLLELLAANIGSTVDASAMMTAIWQRDELSNRNSLHGYIHKLRHLLCHDPHIAIVNQRAYGYMLTTQTIPD